MVESAHAAGFWPSLYEPLRGLGGRIADWFAPASEAGTDKQGYRIDLELPGVKQEDVDITVHDLTITVKGEKREHSERKEGDVFNQLDAQVLWCGGAVVGAATECRNLHKDHRCSAFERHQLERHPDARQLRPVAIGTDFVRGPQTGRAACAE